MTSDRLSIYMDTEQGRAIGLRVNGIKILVTPGDRAKQAAAIALAEAIAALGPAEIDAPEETVAPIAEEKPYAPKIRDFAVGQRVWCNVWASRGYVTITEIGSGRNRGRVKISSCRGWCPIGNFDAEAPEPAA